MGNTSSSLAYYAIFEMETNRVRKLMRGKKFAEAFGVLYGITMAAHRHDLWMHDTEDLGESVSVVRNFANCWKKVGGCAGGCACWVLRAGAGCVYLCFRVCSCACVCVLCVWGVRVRVRACVRVCMRGCVCVRLWV